MLLTIKQVLEAASKAYGAPGLMQHVIPAMMPTVHGGAFTNAQHHASYIARCSPQTCPDPFGHGVVIDIIEWIEPSIVNNGTIIEHTQLDQVFDRMHSDIRRIKNAIDALERKAI